MTYLLPTHTDIPMRATADKEPSTFDLDQLFEQYVDTGLFQQFSSDDTPAEQSSDDLAHLFEVPSSNGSIPLKTSTLPDLDTSIHGTSWHKAVHRQQKQNLASPDLGFLSSSIYPDSSGKACLSDSDLLSFDDLFESDDTEPKVYPDSSQTTTHTPRITRTSSLDRLSRHGVKKTTRKPSSLSNLGKMMRPSHYCAGFQDIWTRKIDTAPETFNLQIPSNGFRSSSPPSTVMQEESGNQILPRDTQNYTVALSPALYGEATATTPELHTSNYQLTPLSSPAIDMNSKMSGGEQAFQVSSEATGNAYMSQHFSSAALSALQTPPPTQRLPMGVWGADTTPNLDFDSAKDDAWWSAASSSVPPFPQPSPSNDNHHQDTFPASSPHTSTNVDDISSSSVVAGLGITCDTASFTGFGGDLSSTAITTPSANNNNNNHGISSVDVASSFDLSTYSTPHHSHHPHHLYHAPPSPGIPIGTGPARPPSPSNPPSHSPRPLFTRRRHSQMPSSHHQSHHTHTRRKSSTNASSSHASAHRNGSSSSSSGHPGGSVTAAASSSSASVGFVNFTPSDSRKILTGVAPSGSSKTKARREKEAAEKRRKLSQAAVKAVIEAGGDLGRLEKEGLLALEG
ncbi:hypothetical protein DM02DRAFT_641969 [Periconia macrospinosa]|uniref:Developmental regulatory protein wetA n=1 Tax=Periconia macrospinosa TaxID=97972 RepID=A0A2V1DTL4_9PLEO|nr:hypothetical protein DM02DRAFT_641969 [Periconia macrospinosa]